MGHLFSDFFGNVIERIFKELGDNPYWKGLLARMFVTGAYRTPTGMSLTSWLGSHLILIGFGFLIFLTLTRKFWLGIYYESKVDKKTHQEFVEKLYGVPFYVLGSEVEVGDKVFLEDENWYPVVSIQHSEMTIVKSMIHVKVPLYKQQRYLIKKVVS